MGQFEVIADAPFEVRGRFDAIIDVRSPSEFAGDHLPGAINLPVLDDAERAAVGTLYVQQSKFQARRIGAALVARNIASHLDGPLSQRPGSFSALVYCWRGGQRSHAMATIMAQVGWRAALLQGGWRSWRRTVQHRLYDENLGLRLVMLDGATGSAKTDILNRAAALGAQAIDLEGLAAHRGSLFGALPGTPQPDQKLFETSLYAALEQLDPARPVLVEAESSKVGERIIPPALWRAMQTAPRILLDVPAQARARWSLDGYAEMSADRAALAALVERLPPRLGRARIAAWRELAEAGAVDELAAALIAEHYDPAYSGSSRRETREIMARIPIEQLGEADRDQAARHIIELLDQIQ